MLLLAVGSVIGTGIFVIMGWSFSGRTGRSDLLRAGRHRLSARGSLCRDREFVAQSGSVYSYAYATVGELLVGLSVGA